MDIGNIDLECPKCSARVSVSLSDIAGQRSARCLNGHTVEPVDDKGGARKADKALKDLDKALDDLGRTINFKL